MKYTIDAKGKRLGRVASEAASLLRGKDSPSFERNKLPDIDVEIINASHLILTEDKMKEKKKAVYSGFPGGIKHISLGDVIEKRGIKEAVRKVVLGMLPRNKQRSRLIKRLVVQSS